MQTQVIETKPLELINLFEGIGESDFRAMQEVMAPWSYTKLSSAACPHYVSMMLRHGRGRDFKGSSLTNRGGENLAAGIAAHEMIENWILFNMGKEQLKQPGQILQNLRISINDWPLLIQQYERAKQIFKFDNGVPQFAGGEIIGVEDEIHVDYDWNFFNHELGKEDDENEDGFFKGTIDLIQWDEEEKILTITDHKRQWNVLSDTDLENHFQFMTYASLALAKYPQAHKVVLRMYFIRHGFYKSVEKFPVELQHIGETIRQQTLAYALKLYYNQHQVNAVPGEQCDTCDLAMSCPALGNGPEINGTIRSREEAEAVAAHLALYKKVVSEHESQLKDWSSVNGTVSSGAKKQYGYVPNKKDSWKCVDAENFLATAKALQGNQPELFDKLKLKTHDLLRLDQKNLDKVMSKLKSHGEKTGDWEPYKALQAFTETRVTTRFAHHNK